MHQFLIFFASIGSLNYLHLTSAQVINTTLGLIQRTSLVFREGRAFSAFLGLPYAKPPIGDLRFRVNQYN